MIYIVGFGKILFAIGALLLIGSIFPRLWARTKDTDHGVNSCLYDTARMQGSGACLFLFGAICIFLPVLLPLALKIIGFCLKVVGMLLSGILELL